MRSARDSRHHRATTRGAKGAGYIRRIIGDLRWNVRLVGSETFTGAEGRQSARSELRQITARQGRDPQGAVRSLEQLYRRERARIDRIERESADLPEALRASESIAQQSLIDEIRSALRAARRATASEQPQDEAEEVDLVEAADAERSQLLSGGGPLESSVEEHEGRIAAVRQART